MSRMTYFRLIHQAIDLYDAGKLEEAFELIDRFGNEVEGNQAQLLNLKFCIASRLGHTDLALQLMHGSIVGTDHWYPFDYLFQDEDLKNIRERKEFAELSEICKERERWARKNVRAELKLMMPGVEAPTERSWFIALHGNGDSVALTEKNWYPVLSRGHPLAFPQSSQMISYETYTWSDLDQGLEELKGHLSGLRGEHGLKRNEWILAGFSGGARSALYSVLHGGLRPKGLILIAPWLPELKEWEGSINDLDINDMRVCIVCGDKDKIGFESAKMANEVLVGSGIPTSFEVVAGLDHDFPEDLPERLDRMLDFIDRR